MFSINEDTDEVPSEQINPSLGAASRRMKAWVGEEIYTDALSDTPTDSDRKLELTMAESYLAMHFALPGLNINVSNKGVVKTEKVEGDAVLQYLTPNEVKTAAADFLARAEEIATPYRQARMSLSPIGFTLASGGRVG